MHKYIIVLILAFGLSNCKSQNHSNLINMNNHKYTNNLINESSPYLLQHAHNPVNWEAWHPEVLERAKKENKLIIISIGYAACHWCHVMEHESFEDSTVAQLMNENFISIKIDREERPDIDQVYMTAVQLLTGRGGWPLNVVALPDGRPVWGGTYFSKDKWVNALDQLANIYKSKPEELVEYAEGLTKKIIQSDLIKINNDKSNFKKTTLDKIVLKWENSFDNRNGGTIRVPKFPLPNNYEFLLRYSVQSKDKNILNFVELTLKKIAHGGIYDHIGGGFARYSTDGKWHIPHFEKMLYDNAQLVSLYSKAYLVNNNKTYKEIVFETLDFVERELMGTKNNFFSSLDADSENDYGEIEEGAFYVWTKEELQKLLGADFGLFKEYYNINSYGKWEHGKYVLIRNKTDEEFVNEYNIDINKLKSKVVEWKNLLFKQRNKRAKPRLDDKTLTSWNALMIKAYIDSYNSFGESKHLTIAIKNAEFITKYMLNNEYKLLHNYKNDKVSINAHLEDYALVIDALISLYQTTLDQNWLDLAKYLTDYTFLHFYDDISRMFFFTSDEDPEMISRKIETYDGVISSSNSLMANNLFKLSHYYENKPMREVSEQMLKNIMESAKQYGSGYSNWLMLYSDLIGEFYEIAIVGDKANNYANILLNKYIPNKILAGSKSKNSAPLLKNRFIQNKTLNYVCIDGACKLPNEDIQKVIEQINVEYKK